MTHLRRQVEEFYGPLYNYVNELVVTNHVMYAIVDPEKSKQLPADAAQKIKGYLRETHFRPIHEHVATILHSKLYLVEGVDLPDSFYAYLRHSIQERVQREIWTKLHISTAHVPGLPFPNDFTRDIRAGLLAVMERYEAAVGELS